MEFVRYLWDIVDPGEELVSGWAMESIASHLEACYYGHIKRLVITVPPGFSKSSLCNVFFPLWVWIQEGQAHNRFIHASYEQGIPERDNLKARNIINHEKFQRFWGDKFKLVVPNTVDRFENDHTGWKMATAVGAKLIGHRGNYIIIDDPNDPSIENQSGAKRIKATRWLRETVPTRLNNMARDKIILIQQRLHMQDCAGVAINELQHEQYVHLNIPMEHEPRLYINAYVPGGKVYDDDEEEDPDAPEPIRTLYDNYAQEALDRDPDCVFWSDPRTVEGELAWPERFPRREVNKLKRTLDRTMVAAQLQQRPVPRGGNLIPTESWKTWDKDQFPPFSFILATLDTASTEDEQNDPSGLIVWGLFYDSSDDFNITYHDRQGRAVSRSLINEDTGLAKVMLLYAWTDWMDFDPLVRRVLHTCSLPRDPANPLNYGEEWRGLPRFPVDKLIIEGKANGISAQQEIVRLLTQGKDRYLSVDLIPPKMLRDDKRARLLSVSHLWTNGIVYAPDKEYADKVIDQVGNFPYDTHDEYVDCSSAAMRWFRDMGFAPTREQIIEQEESIRAFRPTPPPLYGGV